MDRPIFLLHIRALAAAAALGLVAAACGSPSKPTVVVPPTDPPSLTCPTVPESPSAGGSPIPVAYADPIVSGGQQPFTLSCAPVSGATFPVGTTDVTCTITDARRRTATCTFPIKVIVPKPSTIGLTKFVAFGDSITYGEDGRALVSSPSTGLRFFPSLQVPLFQTYPNVLQSLLAARYSTQTFVVDNAGSKGEQVNDSRTLSRFSSVVGSGRYEAVLILEGANDLFDRDARLIPAVVEGLRQMIGDARSRGVRPFLATLPPQHHGCCPDRGLASTLVPMLNAEIRALAEREGADLVDLYDAMLPAESTYIGFDGLHPTVEGYAKMANTFFEKLGKTLEIKE
ncbi:MAG: HYR domain-containing protein [Acidobacteria bacterium]|nr:HYR domain-containing protein [Acidobacteriota bacterium]